MEIRYLDYCYFFAVFCFVVSQNDLLLLLNLLYHAKQESIKKLYAKLFFTLKALKK